MKRLLISTGMMLTMWVAGAHAGLVGVSNVVTNLDGNGDRAFVSTEFVSSPTTLGAGSTAVWADGTFTNNVGTYGWTDAINRDMSTAGNAYSGNPDRADFSSPYAGEASSTGTIAEIFGVNNLSRIIDGEDNGAWTLDLLLPSGDYFANDGDTSTVEIAIFERGMNSKIGVRGIYASNGGYAYTSGVVINPSDLTYAGWKLDTLEINGEQKVGGVGLSLEDLGAAPSEIIGIHIYAENGFNGPDLVGVLGGNVVPEPSTLALLMFGLCGLMRRR
jgi:hypothetical protein